MDGLKTVKTTFNEGIILRYSIKQLAISVTYKKEFNKNLIG